MQHYFSRERRLPRLGAANSGRSAVLHPLGLWLTAAFWFFSRALAQRGNAVCHRALARLNCCSQYYNSMLTHHYHRWYSTRSQQLGNSV